ncbi:hypothetical protein NDU88_008945 [Pleurodeles waltl]|uniref:Uncharacterized protein n=1 Tax=Pleurodeles waltl TaxID=8319 RepID=A0AAV7QQ52_PLEWA|nr:hypothetical protein NDU88_008945 [Pleurodeles waltl]
MHETLNKILGAIEDSKLSLQRDIGKDSAELSLLNADHHKFSDKVTVIETSVADQQPSHQALKLQVLQLADRVNRLEHLAKDAEGRSQRNNICIVGLLEGMEGTSMGNSWCPGSTPLWTQTASP